LTRRATCDGAERSPALRWSGVPADAAELAVFIVNLRPVNHKLLVDWSVAGLSPKLHGLEAGKLPAGAIVGRNGVGRTGYSLCPHGGAREEYVFAIYAPTKRSTAKRGFEPIALRSQILQSSSGDGILIAGYRREV
jgi:phosphatidylethanolamine-binding protein (PEBP) family uncharacterized protein